MNALALNATYRPDKTTSRLTERALEGAASIGAETEMVYLIRQDIQFCRNCLTCYKDQEAEIAACPIKDDVRGILEKIRDADAIIMASPVHSGFVTGLMATFIERATFTLLRPTGILLGFRGVPEPRLTNKVRPSATILSAGMIPTEMREYCDTGTPYLKDYAEMAFNGELIADMYAGAVFTKELTDDEWSRAFLFRELTEKQLTEAFNLGVKLVEAVKTGTVRPYDPRRIEEAYS
jgi:multimeric flavodoxin WrbA